jgi:hypothetical protein
MTTVPMDTLVHAVKLMTDNVNKLIDAQTAQQTANAAAGAGKSKVWDDMAKYKNINMFTGDQKEWEEFQVKFRSQVAAGDHSVVEIMDDVERSTESAVEEGGWTLFANTNCDEDMISGTSKKMYNVLLSLTTKEANAVVMRCRGNGLWAWKRLSSALNPRTLASGIKMISNVLNRARSATQRGPTTPSRNGRTGCRSSSRSTARRSRRR